MSDPLSILFFNLRLGPRPGIGAATIGGNVGEPEGVVAAEMAGGRRRTRTARQRMIRRRQDDDDYDDFYDEGIAKLSYFTIRVLMF